LPEDPPTSAEETPETIVFEPEEFLRRARAGTLPPGATLTDADLSDLDLRGVAFRETYLEHIRIRGCNLAGADFVQHFLDHMNLFVVERIGHIDQMKQQVGATDRFQGALERLDQ